MIDYLDSWIKGSFDQEFHYRSCTAERLKNRSKNLEKKMQKKVAQHKEDLRRFF